MNRRFAIGLLTTLSGLGALSVACSGQAPGTDESSGSTASALAPQRDIGDDPPPRTKVIVDPPPPPVDAGRDTGPKLGTAIADHLNDVTAVQLDPITPAWATTCSTNRYFVNTEIVNVECSSHTAAKMNTGTTPPAACGDITATGGTWHGARLFPNAPNGRCIYTWTGTGTQDYGALESVAVTRRSCMFPDPGKDIIPDCSPAPTTCSTAGATCMSIALAPPCIPPNPNEPYIDGGNYCHIHEGTPLCPDCGNIQNGVLYAVLDPVNPANSAGQWKAVTQNGTVVHFIAPNGAQTFAVPLPADAVATPPGFVGNGSTNTAGVFVTDLTGD